MNRPLANLSANPLAATFPATRETLRDLALSLPSPESYYFGVGADENALPGNIITFTRRRRETLERRDGAHEQHHRAMLLTAVEGEGIACLDAEQVRLAEGEAVMIFPFQFHRYAGIGKARVCWNFITFEMPPAALEALEGLRYSPRRLGPVEWTLLGETLLCIRERQRHSLAPLHLGLLLRRLAAMKAGAPGKARKGEPNEAATFLMQVNRHVLPRLHQRLSLVELGRALGQSESHLRARFRTLTGVSLGGHLRALRIQKACNLLHSTALPVTAVAEQCGFESLYSFSRSFKAARGVSPRAYRQGRRQ